MMRILVPAVALGLLALALPAAADHLQMEGGKTVAFDHVAGNQYWVEVRLSGDDAATVQRVDVSSRSMAWTAMRPTSWGTWALNQFVPGEPVRFLATWSDGTQVASCAFSHPQGVEGCGPAPFTAEFHDVRGNAWWLQAGVYASEPLAGVDVRLNGGAWKPLTKQSWGTVEWAASYHAPQGTMVQFRAVSQSGQVALSGCYQWTSGTPMDCSGTPPPPPPPPPGFDATFSDVQGNQWWVQVTVGGDQAIAKVDVRLNCAGSWKALTYRGYGWSNSYNIPAGTKVDFRATSASGAVDLSGGYTWPRQVEDGENVPAASTTPC